MKIISKKVKTIRIGPMQIHSHEIAPQKCSRFDHTNTAKITLRPNRPTRRPFEFSVCSGPMRFDAVNSRSVCSATVFVYTMYVV